MGHPLLIVGDDEALAFRLQIGDVLDSSEHGIEITFTLVELHFAALDLGHVQDIVDQGQKEMAGGSDLVQRLRDQFRVIPVAFRDIGVPDDGVHRSPDVMGHIGEKVVLRAGARFGHMLPVFLLPLHLGVDIVGTDDQVATVLIHQQRCLHADINRFTGYNEAVFHGKASVPLQDGHDLLLVEGPQKPVPVLRKNDAAHVPAAYFEEIVSLFLHSELVVFFRGTVFDEVVCIGIHHVDAEIVPRQRPRHL